MRCLRHQRVDHKRFPAWILGNPGSTYIIPIQYDVWQDHPTFHQSRRQYNSVLRIIEHNLVTSGIPLALYVERRTAMLNQVAHLVLVAYVDLRLPPTW